MQPAGPGLRVVTTGRSQIGKAHVEGFAEFYAAHFNGITLQLFAYTADLGVAQELTQEAFTRAVPRWDRLRRYDDPAAWVRRVAFNLANSRWRRARTAERFARRQREEPMEGPNPDRVALVRALAILPAQQRRAVALHYRGGLSVLEIAAQEQVAEGTVKSWLHRGRTALAVALTDSKEARNV
jgi:RNA polymerase sigma-70 factor (ECF subfamily)